MKKNTQPYPYSNCTFHQENSQRVQTNFTVPTNLIENFGQHNLLYVSLSVWKTREKLCKNKHGENCIAQVVCWYFVRLCGAAGVGCEVSEGKKPSKPIHILTALFTTRTNKKQTSFTVPTDLGKTLANIICCMCIFQHVGKQDRNHARTNMVKIALRKLFAGILCGCVVLLVGYEVSDAKKIIQTYPDSNCTFHHQNSQRKQANFTVPTNLIENFGQHNLLYVSLSVWKTGEKRCKNKHGENCIAQVVCLYFVRLCGAAGVGCEVSEGKKQSKLIHILTALFTTRVHKENKQVLPYQPTSGKNWPT